LEPFTLFGMEKGKKQGNYASLVGGEENEPFVNLKDRCKKKKIKAKIETQLVDCVKQFKWSNFLVTNFGKDFKNKEDTDQITSIYVGLPEHSDDGNPYAGSPWPNALPGAKHNPYDSPPCSGYLPDGVNNDFYVTPLPEPLSGDAGNPYADSPHPGAALGAKDGPYDSLPYPETGDCEGEYICLYQGSTSKVPGLSSSAFCEPITSNEAEVECTYKWQSVLDENSQNKDEWSDFQPGKFTQMGKTWLQEINFCHLSQGIKLGSGNFGVVYCVKWEGAFVAVKQLKFKHKNTQDPKYTALRNDFAKEVQQMAGLYHPRLVTLYGISISSYGHDMLMVMEFCQNGNLRAALNKAFSSRRKLSYHNQFQIVLDILEGLKALHDFGIIHGDLAAENILLDEKCRAKLADFGLAAAQAKSGVGVQEEGSYTARPKWSAPEIEKVINITSYLMGTPLAQCGFDPTQSEDLMELIYQRKDAIDRITESDLSQSEKWCKLLPIARSVILSEVANVACDMYSFGKVLFEIATGKEPKNRFSAEPLPDDVDEQMVQLMEACWELDPRKRPSAETLFNQLVSKQLTTCGSMEMTVEDVIAKLWENAQNLGTSDKGLMALYIPLQHSDSLHDKSRHHLDQTLQEFLFDSSSQVLLLVGDSGSGKTSTLQRLVHQLASGEVDSSGRVPVYVRLSDLQQPSCALEEHFEQLGLSRSLRGILCQNKVPLLVIVDGYDEINSEHNLFVENQWYNDNIKLIIGCRKQRLLGKSYLGWFCACNANREPQDDTLKQVILQPLDHQQINSFLQQYVRQHEETLPAKWRDSEYFGKQIESIPGLYDLAKNPLLLTLVVSSLPSLVHKNTGHFFTRFDLYETFLQDWFKEQEKHAQGRFISNTDIHKKVMCYCCNLASVMFLHDVLSVHYCPAKRSFLGVSQQQAQHAITWGRFLDGRSHPLVLVLRGMSPLQQTAENQWQFLHKSVWEYFVAHSLVRELLLCEKKNANTLVLLNKKSLNGETGILDFLKDMILSKRGKLIIDRLWETIDATRHHTPTEHPLYLGANAATILNWSNMSFSGRDLRKVCLKGADLRSVTMSYTDLRKSDLRGALLHQACLSSAKLQGSRLDGVDFGEFPCIQTQDEVNCVSYSPTGEVVAVATGACVRLFELSTRECVGVLNGHTEPIGSVAYSKDGRQIVTGGWDKSIKLWDVETGECVATILGHQGDVNSVAYRSDGRQIASGSDDTTVKIWDTKSRNCVHVLSGHECEVTSVAYQQDGDFVVSGSYDKTVRLWDSRSGDCVVVFQGHTGYITSVAWRGDGQQVASGSWDNTVRVWDIQRQECVFVLKGHTDGVNCVAYQQAGDGKQLASGSDDKTLRLWDVESGNCVVSLSGHTDSINSITYCCGGKHLASGGDDRAVRLWKNEATPVLLSSGQTNRIVRVTFDNEGKHLASASFNGRKIWDAETGQLVKTFPGKSVTSVSYSTDSKKIATSSGSVVKILEVESGKCVRELRGHTSRVSVVSYRSDSKQVASGSLDKTVRLWDVGTGECAFTLVGHTHWVRSVRYRGDGRQVASGSADETVRLWDVETGDCVHVLSGHTSFVTSVQYREDGLQIASASYDKTVRVWDVVSGDCLFVLSGHSCWATCVTYLPFGLASGSFDTTVKLWELQNGTCTHTLFLSAGVSSVGSCGRKLVAGGGSCISVWLLDDEGPLLQWTTQPILLADGALVTGAHGLTRQQLQLLEQHGAVLQTPELPDQTL